MATRTALTTEQLAAIPDSYFKAVDAFDVKRVGAHFAVDAVMSVQTDHRTFNGRDEIERMFSDFFAASKTIFHDIRNMVVQTELRKVATEQGYQGELKDGNVNDMHNCNFFDINEDGEIQRMIIWMAGTNPLK
jgi:ketosteroid isomerase-like protein